MTLKDELFGPEKEVVYKQVASELNGIFSRGDFYNPLKVNVPFKNWIITMDTNVTKDLINVGSNPYGNSEYTRIRATFLKTGNFRMAISNSSSFAAITKIFGAQDIVIGDTVFDKMFMIKGNDETKVRLILSNEMIRYLLMELKEINFVIREEEDPFGTRLPEDVNELFLKCEDIIIDIKTLKLQVKLFSELLDQLSKMGIAKNENPNVLLS